MNLKVAVVLTFLGLAGVAACRPRGEAAQAADSSSPAQPPAQSPADSPTDPLPPLDTLRGLVRRVGNEPMSRLVLQAGSRYFSLSGDAAATLSALEGLEVMVAGQFSGANDPLASPAGAPVFSVEWFAVRASEGVGAHDGLLVAEGSGYALRLRDGVLLSIAVLPESLRGRVGQRVFLVGALDRPLVSYGLIPDQP